MKKITILLFAFAILSGNALAQKKWKVAFKFGPAITKDHYGDLYPQSLQRKSQYALGLSTGFDFYRYYENNFFFKTVSITLFLN